MWRSRLDSSHPGGGRWRQPLGRLLRQIRCEVDGKSTISDPSGRQLEHLPDPPAAINWLDQHRGEGRRWVGFLSYDLGSWLEPAIPHRTSDLPLLAFAEHELAETSEPLPDVCMPRSEYLGSDMPLGSYITAIRKAIGYISAGDIFQVNIAQQLQARTDATAMELYATIGRMFPAWYAALLDYGDFALISNSPELFLKTTATEGGLRIETRPIKGTRPRAQGMEHELRNSIKDQAELNMIVDLERNDLGRICEIGSVQVTEARTIETHPTVYHGSATVAGRLRPGTSLLEILKATFPGGSITGAPKIRATQIIYELEPTARGPYCGAIGYLDAGGQMELNIAIRTMIYRDGLVSVPVGGGIVADSDPQREYAETLTKARAALGALGLA